MVTKVEVGRQEAIVVIRTGALGGLKMTRLVILKLESRGFPNRNHMEKKTQRGLKGFLKGN